MLQTLKNNWKVAGISTILTELGIDKVLVSKIVKPMDSDTLRLIFDCTKDLESHSKDLCNALFVIKLYNLNYKPTLENQLTLKIAIDRIMSSIEYQGIMGQQSSIEECFRRFEYILEKFYSNQLLRESKKNIKHKERIEEPTIDFDKPKEILCLKCMNKFVSSRGFCPNCKTANFITDKL